MKIWLSRPHSKTGKRHVVLDMTSTEEHACFGVLREQVIGYQGIAPRRKALRGGTVRYRFSRSHLDRLMATFPYAELSPGLERRARRAVQAALEVPVPDLDIPDLRADLYGFQKISVAQMLESLDEQGWFFNNDDMGLGKTIQSLAVLVKTMAVPALIVCTGTARWVWASKLEEHTDLDDVVVIDCDQQRPAERVELLEQQHDVTIINFEAMRIHAEQMGSLRYKLLISDEVHHFKNPSAKQSQVWFSTQAERQLLLTGTPILNRVEEIWSGLHKVDPERWPNYWQFERWLCIKSKAQVVYDIERDDSGRLVRDSRGRVKRTKRRLPAKVVGYHPDRFAVLREYVQDPKHACRRRRDQVLDDLPEVVYNRLLVDLTPEQRRLYRQIVQDMKIAMENGEIRTLQNMLSVVTRAKQACFSPELYGGSQHSAKITELKNLVQQLVDSGRKALIGSQWSTATKILRRELVDFNPAYVDGSVKGRLRAAEQDRFNEDEDCHIYIGTITANQEAITLSAATDVIFTDKMWSPLANDQFVGRSAAGGLRGVGHEGSVCVTELYAHNTIEDRIEAVLEGKKQLFNSLVEKDRGAAVTRTTVRQIADLF